jgi:hypothetical protein
MRKPQHIALGFGEVGSVEAALPIGGNATCGSGDRLFDGMAVWGSQRRSVEKLTGGVVEEPVFAGFETLNHWVSGFGGMLTGVLRR